MSKKIRILYSIPNFDTAGSGKVVYDLVKGLDKSKFAPEILVKHTKGAFFKEVEKLGVPIHIFDYETNYKPLWSFPFRVLKVVRFFKKHQWDVIHSWHWSSDFSEALAAKLAGIKFVYTKKAMGWGNKAWKWRSQLSTKVIAINESMMTEFFDEMPSVDAVYIPLGLDTNIYKPIEPDKNILDQYGISENEFITISVVNMVPVKGIEVLIEAFVKANISNSKLFLVGNDQNEYVNSLKDKYLKNHKNIIFTGKQLDVISYLSISDVFVIPTKNKGKREGMPMAPVEAMSMGLPVIGSEVAGITDILKGFEENLFKAEDVENLSSILVSYSKKTKKERTKIGLDMREKVVNQYHFEQFIKSREELYEKI